MNLIKDFEEINRTTLTKDDKSTIAVITKFNDDSRHATQFAVDLLGIEVRYVLLNIYSLENALASRSNFPTIVRAEVTEKLIAELKTIRCALGKSQPEILIDFAFGSKRQVLEKGWHKGHYDMVVMSTNVLGWFDSVPTKKVPTLIVPQKEGLTKEISSYLKNSKNTEK